MTKPFSAEDLYLHRKITELDCSCVHTRVACAVRSVDRDSDDYVSCIWAYALDGGWSRQLTFGPGKPKPRGESSPEVAWRLPYKTDGMGYMLSREVHLFRLDAETGDITQLTDGGFDVLAAAVSPEGQRIAFVRTREGRFAHRSDLWLCDADGSNARQLTHEHAMVLQPSWSPDGRRIVFAGAVDEGDAQQNLWLVDVADRSVRRIGDESLVVSDAESLRWTGDGKGIVFVRAHRGRHQVACVDVASGHVHVQYDRDVQIGAFGATQDVFALSVDHPTQPCELFACALDGGEARCLSALNPWWKDRIPLEFVAREFDVPDGKGGRETIDGWLLKTAGAKGPMPLLNDVHGGPAAYVQLDFDTNVFWQVLCSNGWAVLMLDAVGSASYGREFCERLQGHWGDYDLPQHLEAVRRLQAEGVCDERVAISGKSYGGFLSGWAIGHTDLFRAAVVMAPVGNIETHYGTSDGGYYADPLYMGSGTRFDRGLARKLSPMISIEKARTPTLFLQGKEDERCPKCQAEELFVSMMRASDTPAELVLYPGEDHHFLGEGKPSVRRDAAQRIVDWLRRHAA